jgi:murein L,D-transpeptidase YcbB/YkuD
VGEGLRSAAADRALTSPPAVAEALKRFYGERDREPFWLAPDTFWRRAGPTRDTASLLTALRGAARHGLDPEVYGADELAERIDRAYRGGAPKPALRDELEVALSAHLLWFLSDLSRGRVDPSTLPIAWHLPRPDPDLSAWLELAQRGDLDEALRRAAPPHPEYRSLLVALDRYRDVADDGGWPTGLEAPAGEQTRSALRGRLRAEGYGGRDLEQAVRAFQRDHGIDEDGIVGEQTLVELNVPVESRVRQIELNLERWRWVPRELALPRVEVNVPSFELDVLDADGRDALSMRVVVGDEARTARDPGDADAGGEDEEQDRSTPIFSDEIETIVLNPYWNVPASIASEEIVPALIEDPEALSARNLEVVRGFGDDAEPVDPADVDWNDWEDLAQAPDALRLRQLPGPGNALGHIKFMLPNRMNIYLHDTPEESLFAETDRNFSHGCIRVEEPLALAVLLLRDDPSWDEKRIREAIDSGERVEIALPAPVAIQTSYWTALADDSERVAFHQDLYGIDAALLRALDGASAR